MTMNNRNRTKLAETAINVLALLRDKGSFADGEATMFGGMINNLRQFSDKLGGLDEADKDHPRIVVYRDVLCWIPHWANYLATDGDGEVWAYSNPPSFCDCNNPRCAGTWGDEELEGGYKRIAMGTAISREDSAASCVRFPR